MMFFGGLRRVDAAATQEGGGHAWRPQSRLIDVAHKPCISNAITCQVVVTQEVIREIEVPVEVVVIKEIIKEVPVVVERVVEKIVTKEVR